MNAVFQNCCSQCVPIASRYVGRRHRRCYADDVVERQEKIAAKQQTKEQIRVWLGVSSDLLVRLIAVADVSYLNVSPTLRAMLKSNTCAGSTGCLGLICAAASAIIWR